MKYFKVFAALAVMSLLSLPSMAWSPKGDRIMTRWGKNVSPESVWKSYPRPQLQRDEWENLNGLWECSLTDGDTKVGEVDFSDEILVPFSYESALSGIGGKVLPEDKLWYRRNFTVPNAWKGKRILLHFGAVDYECVVLVNNKTVGSHKGGNNPFTIDITSAVKAKGANSLVVAVTDPTDKDSDTRGKQILSPHGIWYTAVSGIWKTVWMEPVPKTSVSSVIPTTDIHSGKASFEVTLSGARGDESVEIAIFDGNSPVGRYEGSIKDAVVTLRNPSLWSPANPKLYDFTLTLKRGGKTLDSVKSYLAFRSVSKITDPYGNVRTAINDEPLFQYGTLDQGWWPDGLLTPPSEEAMLFDMVELKKMGFNTIRKHIKVEPDLYYYYADSLGLMIWQDMPSGFESDKAAEQHVAAKSEKDWDAPQEHVLQWKKEYEEMVNNLRFFPSITTWVVFNEGWGQFRTGEMTEFAESLSYGRLINSVTGWTDRGVGDMYDIHNYPSTSMKLKDDCKGRISVLGEFGGLAYHVAGHVWDEKSGWGYRTMDKGQELLTNYATLMYDLEALVSQGLSGAIYTQTTDVESELNGLITYDREVVKMNPAYLNILHSRLYKASPTEMKVLAGKNPEGRIPVVNPQEEKSYTEKIVLDKVPEHFSLWLNFSGSVNVTVNGTQVFSSNVRATRNYNQFNISAWAEAFKEGENVLTFDVKNTLPKRQTSFDYMLTAF